MASDKPMADYFPANDDDPAPKPVANAAATSPRTPEEIAAQKRRYNVATPDTVDEDPFSAAYARTDIDETAGTVLHFWFGLAVDKPNLLAERQLLWFRKSFDTDKLIANRFSDLVARLASGEAKRWAKRSPRDRLAAVIALDQFSRNIFRDYSASFENDALALQLAREGLNAGEDQKLAPLERWFIYMPLMHSESASDQRRSMDAFEALAAAAPPDQREAFDNAFKFAQRHASVIRRFGRFPHRNVILGRTSTTAELSFLAKPGSSF